MEPALLELYAEGVPEDEVAVILRLSDPTAVPDGTRIIARLGLIATARVTRRNLPLVWAARSVEGMRAARRYGPTIEPPEILDVADSFIEAQPGDQRRPDDGLPSGEGVVVAHIDWGVDFAHPDFRRPDGRTRLLALWDQATSYDPRYPNKYGYGRIHSAADINLALATPDPYATLGYWPSASDPLGIGSHGTHTLGISCGNGRSGGPLGLAPAADIIFIHFSTSTAESPTLLGDSATFLEGLNVIRETAGHRPFVVNASLGRQCGEHDGLTLTEQGMDALVRGASGCAICMSTGNYFDRHIHARGTLRPVPGRPCISASKTPIGGRMKSICGMRGRTASA